MRVIFACVLLMRATLAHCRIGVNAACSGVNAA
jgi:hypothetical protein